MQEKYICEYCQSEKINEYEAEYLEEEDCTIIKCQCFSCDKAFQVKEKGFVTLIDY